MGGRTQLHVQVWLGLELGRGAISYGMRKGGLPLTGNPRSCLTATSGEYLPQAHSGYILKAKQFKSCTLNRII